MRSLYQELIDKLEADPRLTRRGGPRPDLGLLLFNARDGLCQLWQAAERYLRAPDDEALAVLGRAVEQLRPVFGERADAAPAGTGGPGPRDTESPRDARRPAAPARPRPTRKKKP